MTYPLDLLDPQGSGRVINNPIPRAPEGTLRDAVTSNDFWSGGKPPAGGTQAGSTPPVPAGRELVPVDGARMVSGDRMSVPGTPYKPNFTIPVTEIPQQAGAGVGPASLRDAAYSAGQKVGAGVNAGKEWLFGAAREAAPAAAAEPAKSLLGRAGQAASRLGSNVGNYGGQALHALGRVGGIAATAESFGRNVEGMSNVFYNDQATLSDKMAAGVEGAGNIIGTGVMSLSNKLPVVGPLVAGAVGPNPASRLIDLADASVLDKFNPGKGFGTTRAESGLGLTPANAATPPTPAPTRYQADLRRIDSGDTSKTQVATPPDPREQQGFEERSPGIYQRGKNEFSDAAGLRDSKFWARGPISAQNMRAADALAARYGQGGMERQAQYQREVEEANQRNAMGRAIEAAQRSRDSDEARRRESDERSEMRRVMDQLNDPTLGRSQRASLTELLKSRMNIGQSERESVRNNSTTQRGQDLTYGSTTRGQDLNYGATLRGQDMDLQGRIAPKQMEIQMQMAQRQRLADALNGSRQKGADGKPGEIDYTTAQQRALLMGDATSAEAIGKMVSGVQGQTEKGNDIRDKGAAEFRKMFAGRATHLNKDGTPEQTKATEERMANDYLAANPGIVNEGRTKQLAAATRAAAEHGLRQRINSLDEGGFRSFLPTKVVGIQREIKKSEGLPEASWWAGAKLSDTVGGIRGAISPNLEKGDQYITLRDGSQLNLGNMSAEELNLVDSLIKQGNSLRGNK